MLKILTVIFCLFVVTTTQPSTTKKPTTTRDPDYDYPGRFYNEDMVSRWQHRHIHNMTENLIKDAVYKLRQADIVQARYVENPSYELGMVAASIMDHWRHMLFIYRYYSNAQDFKNHKHTISQIMNAYSSVQSDYNQIMHEMDLFYRVMEEQRARERANKKKVKVLAKKHGVDRSLIKEMMQMGMDVDAVFANQNPTSRRMMMSMLDTDSMEAFSRNMNNIVKEIDIDGFVDFKFPKEKLFNEWVKKDAKNTEEAEYKKSLRYKKWAEKWDGFNPDIEGVNIPDEISSRRLINASDFLLTELKDDFI